MRASEHPISIILTKRGSSLAWFGRQLEPPVERSRLSHILSGDRPEPEGFYAQAERILGVPKIMLRPAQPSRDVVAGLETLVMAPADADTREAAAA